MNILIIKKNAFFMINGICAIHKISVKGIVPPEGNDGTINMKNTHSPGGGPVNRITKLSEITYI
jgi:hypothetical protein